MDVDAAHIRVGVNRGKLDADKFAAVSDIVGADETVPLSDGRVSDEKKEYRFKYMSLRGVIRLLSHMNALKMLKDAQISDKSECARVVCGCLEGKEHRDGGDEKSAQAQTMCREAFGK